MKKLINRLKRMLGIIWIALSLVSGYYLIVSQAVPKFQSGKAEDKIPAFIYSFILTPIIVGGLFTFGLYSLKGEYEEEN